jgi:hypothetical protein
VSHPAAVFEAFGFSCINGLLLKSAQDILSIPTAKRQEFNEKMIRFYEFAEATEMMAFLSRCQIRSKFEYTFLKIHTHEPRRRY